ncbi:MAG: hypothetical protein GEU90_20465, partial [Gemmatimonas sp.]|nr:hypothetical protein [Gemmatimonas sp.]
MATIYDGLYSHRAIEPPRTNAWQEAGRQLTGIGGLIRGMDEQNRARERQQMLDERDETRYQEALDWRGQQAATEQERFDLGQRDLGRVRVQPGDDQMSAISEAVSGIEDATSAPGVVPSDSGVGALIRQTNPAFSVGESTYRYDPRDDRPRQAEM